MSDERQEISRGEAVALVTQIAKQRRKAAEPKITQEQPDFIMDIRNSDVRYGFHPRALPFGLADFSIFRSILEKEYGLQFVIPEQLPQLMQELGGASGAPSSTGQASVSLNVDAVGQYLFRLESPMAVFSRGRFDITKRSLVAIEKVSFDVESISVTVSGTTDIAELLIKDLVQYLWASAEADRSWEEIEKNLQNKTFGTSTRVRLGFSPLELLNPRFTEFIDSEVLQGARYGRMMGSRSDRDSFEVPKNSRELAFLDELQIGVSRYDETSCTHQSQTLRIGVGRKDYQGTDVVDINSNLSFEEHIQFVALLIAKTQPSQAGQE